MLRLARILILIGAFSVLGLCASGAWAQSWDEESEWDVVPVNGGLTPDKAKHRLYSGGVDEQDLKVQDVLVIPSRYPDGRDLESETSSHSND